MGIREIILKEVKEQGFLEGEQFGLKKGEQVGLQKGELQKTIKCIKNALERGKLTLEEIADLFEVSLDFVLKVQKGELQ